MKKLMKKQGGFTLIEIIVVLIILGVLAAIALPSLFSNITKSRGAEALASLSSFRSQIEGCVQGHPNNESICTIATPASPNFTYALTGPADGTGAWNVVATGANGAAGAGTITLDRAAATVGAVGTITCSGTGTFAGIC